MSYLQENICQPKCCEQIAAVQKEEKIIRKYYIFVYIVYMYISGFIQERTSVSKMFTTYLLTEETK